MISNRTGKDLGLLTASSSVPTLLPVTPRFVRLAHCRPALALACGLVTAAALGTAASVATVHVLHTAHVAPLAPAPAPLAVTAPPLPKPQKKHRLLAVLAGAHPLRGIASWYGSVLHGHTTASGEIFDEANMTACHRTLPFGTVVRVTDEVSSKSVVVRINDRGVLNADRVIDLSAAAANKLGILRAGLAHVRLEVLAQPPAKTPEAFERN